MNAPVLSSYGYSTSALLLAVSPGKKSEQREIVVMEILITLSLLLCPKMTHHTTTNTHAAKPGIVGSIVNAGESNPFSPIEIVNPEN